MSLSEELAQMHASGDNGQALAGVPERVARLEQERDALRAACEEFVRKCEAGQARSIIRSVALDALRDTAERYWYAQPIKKPARIASATNKNPIFIR